MAWNGDISNDIAVELSSKTIVFASGRMLNCGNEVNRTAEDYLDYVRRRRRQASGVWQC